MNKKTILLVTRNEVQISATALSMKRCAQSGYIPNSEKVEFGIYRCCVSY
jgi:hypothetical protein